MARLGSVAFFKPEVRPGTLTGAQVGKLTVRDGSLPELAGHSDKN